MPREFDCVCSVLAQRVRDCSEAEMLQLCEALTAGMAACFRPGGRCGGCGPILAVVDELTAVRDAAKSLPAEPLKKFLRELLRHLGNNGHWSKQLADGDALLRKLNLSVVMLINGMSRTTAYMLLLGLGLEESEGSHTSLVVKCLRKAIKSVASRNVETEVQQILDVVQQWIQKALKRADRGGSCFQALAVAAKEAVENACRASPSAAVAWVKFSLQDGDVGGTMRSWLGSVGDAEGKENASVGEREDKDGAVALQGPRRVLALDPGFCNASPLTISYGGNL